MIRRTPLLRSAVVLGATFFFLPAACAQERSPANRLEVKFVDDLDIGIETGEPRDRAGQVLVSPQALQLLSEISAAGGEWDRLVRMDEAELDSLRARAVANLGRRVGDLANYFILRVPPGVDAPRWMARLEALPEIASVRSAPRPRPAPLVEDFTVPQGYLDPPPGGINAEWAWTLPGGTGKKVVIADLEYSWNLGHEDLPAATVLTLNGKTPYDPFSNDNHGTAVLGEMVSKNDAYGTTGAAFDAHVRVVPVCYEYGIFYDYEITWALVEVVKELTPGDVILIEQQIDGPNSPPAGESQFGLVPMEWNECFYAAVKFAVGNGIHVVAAAGNGSQNLDDSVYTAGHAPFLNDSGAILVGDGYPPGDSAGADRTRGSTSCYGSRVNLQGWGNLVATTGFGDAYDAGDKNRWYTKTFSGTSSAAAMVAAAVALVESCYEETQGSALSPAAMRALLVETGSPQQGDAGAQHIGPRPDVRAAICTFDSGPPEITCPPDIVVEGGGGGVARGDAVFDEFFGGVEVNDDLDPEPVLENDSPVTFPLGTTAVTFTARDACGKESACIATVTVEE